MTGRIPGPEMDFLTLANNFVSSISSKLLFVNFFVPSSVNLCIPIAPSSSWCSIFVEIFIFGTILPGVYKHGR